MDVTAKDARLKADTVVKKAAAKKGRDGSDGKPPASPAVPTGKTAAQPTSKSASLARPKSFSGLLRQQASVAMDFLQRFEKVWSKPVNHMAAMLASHPGKVS